MIHRPDEVAGRLSAALFGDPVRREAFVSLESEGVMAAADRVGGQAATLLRRLAVEASDADTDDVVAGVVRLAADRVVRDLQLDARHASSVEDRQGLRRRSPGSRHSPNSCRSVRREKRRSTNCYRGSTSTPRRGA